MAVKNYMINDKWLDIAKQNIVEVKSTDGVIGSVKVNGEEYGGGGGSSDFSTAEVTFISVSDTYGANVTTVDNDSLKHETYEVSPQNPVTVTIPLYKGKNILPVICIQGNDQSYMPTTEGSIVFDLDSFGYIVTGNGSITAKGRSVG